MMAILAVILSFTLPAGGVAAGERTRLQDEPAVCPVTSPNGRDLPANNAVNHGDGLRLATWVSSPVVFKPGGPGCVAPDGSLLIKWPWWRGVRGQLGVTGRSLDGSRGTVRVAYVPYGQIGFQASALAFPGPGCWEVTGRVAEASLSFVVLVEKIAEGPTSRCDDLFGPGAWRRLRADVEGAAR